MAHVRSFRVKYVTGRRSISNDRRFLRLHHDALLGTYWGVVHVHERCLCPARDFRHVNRPSPFHRRDLCIRTVFPQVLRRMVSNFCNRNVSQPKRATNACPKGGFPTTHRHSRARPQRNVTFNRKVRGRCIERFRHLNCKRRLFLHGRHVQLIGSGRLSKVYNCRSTGHNNVPYLPHKIVQVARPRGPLVTHRFLRAKGAFRPVSIRTTNVNVFAGNQCPCDEVASTGDLNGRMSNFHNSVHRASFLQASAVRPNRLDDRYVKLQFQVKASTQRTSNRMTIRPIVIRPVMRVQARVNAGNHVTVNIISISIGRFRSMFNGTTTYSNTSTRNQPTYYVILP